MLTAYSVVLTVHSYVRWALVVVGVVVWLKSMRAVGRWSVVDERLSRALVGLTDLQLLLGLFLHQWLSPLAQAGQAMTAIETWAQPTLRFFTYLHPAIMVLGLVAVHAGQAMVKRRETPQQKWQVLRLTTTLWLMCVLLAIPWPFFDYGRPWFRIGES